MTEHQIGKGQDMVMQFQKLILALEVGQLIHLIEGSQLPRLAALTLEHLLIETQVVDQPAAADRPAKELSCVMSG
jgi:hypothetical protein